MYKKLLILLTFTLVAMGLIGQTVNGGAGITHVTGDPDNITITQDVDIHESNICFDPANQIMYFFNPSGTAGVDQWDGVSVGSFANSDTRLDNPTVSGGNLVFEILNALDSTPTGATITIPILSIAPVQDVQGGGDVTVTSDASGVYTVTFNETNTSLSIAGSTLTYTDEAGADTDITLPSATGAETIVNGSGDIGVSGTGTTADPYVVSFSETNTSLSISGSTLTYTDEGGTANSVTLPTYDGSETEVTGTNDIGVTGSGTTADPYVIDFSETNTSLSIAGSTLTYTDEAGADTDITLPSATGAETIVNGSGDIGVSGTGTTADPYVVSFSETNTSLSISGSTLTYTDEGGTANSVTLPTYDGSETEVTGTNDIGVTGSGTTADPYVIDFSETNTSLSIAGSVLTYTDEAGADTDITLPSATGAETIVNGSGDIGVSGTGTTADPYVVSFSETNTSLSISGSTLTYTDEGGTANSVTLPTYDGSETEVTGTNDIGVTGSGTTADPYVIDFLETNTSLSIAGSVLTYTDEAGADTDITLPSATGAETKVNGSGDIGVSGTGTTADPYVVSFSETNTSLSISGSTLTYTDEAGTGNTVDLSALQHEAVTVTDGSTIDFTASGTDSQTITAEITGSAAATNGQIPLSDGSGGITWSNANITSIAADANGRLVATLSSGATVTFDLNSAPRVASMSDLDTAANALTSGQTGIAVSDDGNTLGLPSKEDGNVEIGVLFFIKKK